MIEYFALGFCEAYQKLCGQISALFLRDKEDRTKPISQRILSEGYKLQVAKDALEPTILELQRLELSLELRQKATLLFARLADPASRSWTAELLLDSLIQLRQEIGLELKRHKFVHLRSPNDEYFDRGRLFGDDVYNKLKSARDEIKDSGNCFAAELYTASVFHSMRW